MERLLLGQHLTQLCLTGLSAAAWSGADQVGKDPATATGLPMDYVDQKALRQTQHQVCTCFVLLALAQSP